MASQYIERQIASEKDSLAIARRNYDGLLVDLHHELARWYDAPATHQVSRERVDRLIQWAYDQQGVIDLAEARVAEVQAELPL